MIPDLKYDGPLDIPGVDESYRHHVRGQENEAEMVRKVEEFSRKECLHLKIFHGVEVTRNKLEALCKAFNLTLALVNELEMDVVAISYDSIYLIEVKSSTNDKMVEKAFSQLEKVAAFIFDLLQSVGLETISVTKIFAAPGPFSEKVEKEANQNSVHCFNTKNTTCEGLFKTSASQQVDSVQPLIAALAFLTSCRSFKIIKPLEDELERACLEGPKGQETAEKLKVQNPLRKWKFSSRFEFIWLDPDQSKVLNDANPFQMIIGPASTGKTILIQLKIMQILKKDEDAKIMVLVLIFSPLYLTLETN